MSAGALEFRVVDVFAERAFAGNPLAVVLDADGLSDAALQAIAREFNLSETAFPVAASPAERAAGADYRLRIFTPVAELPFAGHPSVGAAWVLADSGRVSRGLVRQACGAGVLPLTVGADAAELTGAAPHLGPPLDPALALEAAGLAPADIVDPPPGAAGTGIDFGFLLVRSEAVPRARPDLPAIQRLAGAGAPAGLSVSAWDPDQRTAHTRVFAGDLGVPEDPATGSAALGLGAFLVAAGLLPSDGETGYTVLQGAEIGRPSRLAGRVVARAGQAVQCRVSGRVVPVSTGRIVRPGA